MTLLLAFLVLTTAHADDSWTKIPSKEFSMPAPPARDSAEWKEDFRQLHLYQRERSQADCKLAQSQPEPEFEMLFGPSKLLNRSELERSQSIVGKAMRVSERIATYFKGQYKRQRPYDVDSALQPCAKKPGGAKSYPSSHASAAATGACLLAEIYPDRATQLHEYGAYLGELRAIVGVHHPSDVHAGQTLGLELCARLLKDSGFRRDLP